MQSIAMPESFDTHTYIGIHQRLASLPHLQPINFDLSNLSRIDTGAAQLLVSYLKSNPQANLCLASPHFTRAWQDYGLLSQHPLTPDGATNA